MFPRYLMKSRPDSQAPWTYEFLPLPQAGALFDSGWVQVEIGRLVLMDDTLSVREMTGADECAISDAADRHSESK